MSRIVCAGLLATTLLVSLLGATADAAVVRIAIQDGGPEADRPLSHVEYVPEAGERADLSLGLEGGDLVFQGHGNDLARRRLCRRLR